MSPKSNERRKRNDLPEGDRMIGQLDQQGRERRSNQGKRIEGLGQDRERSASPSPHSSDYRDPYTTELSVSRPNHRLPPRTAAYTLRQTSPSAPSQARHHGRSSCNDNSTERQPASHTPTPCSGPSQTQKLPSTPEPPRTEIENKAIVRSRHVGDEWQSITDTSCKTSLGNRNASQIQQRETELQENDTEDWSQEKDRLLLCFKASAHWTWKAIGSRIHNRFADDCKERWHRFLKLRCAQSART